VTIEGIVGGIVLGLLIALPLLPWVRRRSIRGVILKAKREDPGLAPYIDEVTEKRGWGRIDP
jgi:hypothetical protein